MTEPTFGWAAGLILFVLLPLVVVAIAACIVGEDRDHVRRAAELERGRQRMASDGADAAARHQQRLSHAATLIERHGWRWPDVERLPESKQ